MQAGGSVDPVAQTLNHLVAEFLRGPPACLVSPTSNAPKCAPLNTAVEAPDLVAYMAGILLEELSYFQERETAADPKLLADEVEQSIGPFFQDYVSEWIVKLSTRGIALPPREGQVGGTSASDEAAYVKDLSTALAQRITASAKLRLLLRRSRTAAGTTEGAEGDAQSDGAGASGGVVAGNKLPTPFKGRSFLGKDGGFVDPYLGLLETAANFNADIPLVEAIRIQTAAQRERQKQLRLMREWEKSRAVLPAPIKTHGDVQRQKLTDINVHSFTLGIGGRELLKEAQIKIALGRKYGLIGQNGIGKSTLIAALVRKEIRGIPKDTTIGCVEQEMSDSELDRVVLDAVLSIDTERTELLHKEKALMAEPQSEEVGKQLATVYARLEEIDAGAAEGQAASILAGLGFTVEMQKKRVRELSGGWRVRVSLARALFATPDILCLDEPTNHLDLHAVAWLTDHLQSWRTTCIIVSHARMFLNDVCTDIIDFTRQKLKYYHGNYDTYERVKAEAEKLQQRQYEAQQMKREHDQVFIDRFRAKAATAAMVQSRIKALEKLPMLEAVVSDPTQVFKFSEVEALPSPILTLENAWYRYKKNSDDWILKGVDLSVHLDSRIAICGVNGSGKSTLLRLLAGGAEPEKGMSRRNNKLRIGYFSQYHVEQLDLTLNSVQQLQAKYPEANLKSEEARAWLGRFGVTGLLALEPLYVLSGGQKSRAAIAIMAFTNPHVLILDEPTNHLDLNAVQALIAALNDFEGGVVVVSHDVHLLSCVVEEIYHVDPATQTVGKYRGDSIGQYAKDLMRKKNPLATVATPKN